MTTFNLSLRALQHPCTLLSIGLLLLNDHFLKATAPSWLTGKLSDFAGLFFFPFALLALLAWPLTALRVRPRPALAVAILLTAGWFTVIKTVPTFNHFTAQMIGTFWGVPVSIALDPSDLLALPMLGLTWQLGQALAVAPNPQPVGKRAYLALSLAALATLATSPCMPQPRVVRVMSHVSILYAGVAFDYGRPTQLFRSVDGGAMWQAVTPDTPLPEAINNIQQPVPLLKTVCLTADPKHCYAINGTGSVSETLDGEHWQVAWEIPEGRRFFMERGLQMPLACKTSIDLGPYDIALHEAEGQHSVVVALGNEGLLRRTPAGEWERLGLGGANPTAYTALPTFTSYHFIAAELFGSLLLAWLTFVGLSVLAWLSLLKRVSPNLPFWPIVLVFLGIGLLLWALGWQRVSQFAMLGFYALVVALLYGQPYSGLVIGVFILAWGFMWWRASRHAQPKPIWLAMLSILLATLGVAGTAFYFVLWAAGDLPRYEWALALACLTAGLIMWVGFRRVQFYSRLARRR